MRRRSLLELVIAVAGAALIGAGLSQAVGDLGWQTAIGLGLLLVALVFFALTPTEIVKSRFTKYVLVIGGVLLILLPSFQA